MATGGFKIADAFVTIAARNSVPTSIKSVVSALDSIDDKIVQIRGNDSATQVVKRVDAETVDDKIVDITADDAASAKVQKVDSERVGDKIVQVKAQDDATPVIEKAAAKKPDAVKVPVKADDKTQEGLDSIGGKMTAWVAGLGIGGLIGSAIGDGLDKVNLTPHLQNQMGASAEVAAKAGQTAGHVFAQGFTSDKGMIVDAISSLSSEVVNWSNLTQGEQEKISGGAVKVGQTFNQDVTGVIAAASAMVTNRLAPDFNSAFDLITVGFQNVGSRGDDLLETLQEYSGYFTQLGLSGEDAMGLIIQMMKAGARDTDYASDAIKEFGIRAIDGTQQTADGFAAIGLNAKSMSEQVGKGGDSARLALGDVIKALQNIKDPVAQNIAGAALFGTQWEDTMRRVLPNLDLTKTKLEGVSGATNRLVTELTPKQEIGRAWDTLTDGVASGLTGAAKGVGDFGRQIGDVFTLKIFDPDYDNLGLRGYITAAENAKNHTGFFRDMLGMIPPEMKSWGQSALFTNDALKGTTNVVIGLSDAILGLANKDLGYRQSVAATKTAEDALKDALKAHKQGSEEVTAASMNLESAQLRQVQSAEELARAHSKATDEAGKNADASRAGALELVHMAEAANGHLTPAMYSMMANMDVASLAAAGVTISVNKAGQAIYLLPNGKSVVITAEDQASRHAQEVSDYIQRLPPFKTITLNINEIISFGTAGTIPGSNPMSQGRKWRGGPIVGPGTETSDDIPLLASNGEYMIKARAAKKYRTLLDQINEERLPAFAGGGPIGTGGQPSAEMSYGTVIHNHWQLPPDINVERLAPMVSRQIELSRRGRR